MTAAALVALYLLGYAWAFRVMLASARRAYADPKSDMWAVRFRDEPQRIDGMGATLWALGVVFIPLVWPLLWLGRWAWALILRGTAAAAERQP